MNELELKLMIVNVSLVEEGLVELTLKNLKIETEENALSSVEEDDLGSSMFGVDLGQLTNQILKGMGGKPVPKESKNSKIILHYEEYEDFGKPSVGDKIVFKMNRIEVR